MRWFVIRLYSDLVWVTDRFIHSARKDIVLPLGTPIKSADGQREIRNIFVPRHTRVIIGIGAANRDPAVWADEPDVWKPERWIDHSLDQITNERLPGVYAGM